MSNSSSSRVRAARPSKEQLEMTTAADMNEAESARPPPENEAATSYRSSLLKERRQRKIDWQAELRSKLISNDSLIRAHERSQAQQMVAKRDVQYYRDKCTALQKSLEEAQSKIA